MLGAEVRDPKEVLLPHTLRLSGHRGHEVDRKIFDASLSQCLKGPEELLIGMDPPENGELLPVGPLETDTHTVNVLPYKGENALMQSPRVHLHRDLGILLNLKMLPQRLHDGKKRIRRHGRGRAAAQENRVDRRPGRFPADPLSGKFNLPNHRRRVGALCRLARRRREEVAVGTFSHAEREVKVEPERVLHFTPHRA